MGVREGILALLVEGAKYGYQIKREFEAATGDAWTLNVGQVYTTLSRLERDGLVETCGEDTKTYRITEAGRAEAAEWMIRPVEQPVASRDEVSMKILLALTTGTVDPVVVIDRQRSATMTSLQDYQRLRSETPEPDLAWLVHLDRLTFQAEAELRWLDRIEDRIQQSGRGRQPVASDEAPTHEAVPTEVGGVRG